VQELERARRVAIVVAHPDDEVIGAGALLPFLRNVHLIYTTDGSPSDLSDARRSGCSTQEEYARARRAELRQALLLAGVPPSRVTFLNFTDQETMCRLDGLCRVLSAALARVLPDVVLTHPYEGGHPDHDSAAFAVHRCFPAPDTIFELTSYHSREGLLESGIFLPNGEPSVVRDFQDGDEIRKHRMLACFKTQQEVLRQFPVVPERFRRAPLYDFSQPPHPGPLFYEQLPWGITGRHWRQLASECKWVRRE
jgi:LmbE family N-acetylglucosaminyl deacetylase